MKVVAVRLISLRSKHGAEGSARALVQTPSGWCPASPLLPMDWLRRFSVSATFPTVCAALASISACSASRCAVSAAFLAFLASLAEALVLPCDAACPSAQYPVDDPGIATPWTQITFLKTALSGVFDLAGPKLLLAQVLRCQRAHPFNRFVGETPGACSYRLHGCGLVGNGYKIELFRRRRDPDANHPACRVGRYECFVDHLTDMVDPDALGTLWIALLFRQLRL